MILDNATRIEAACFTDCDGEVSVSFYRLSGSIIRTAYHHRTTITHTSFVPVDSWEYRELSKYNQSAHADLHHH